ncbi:MAG: cupin domain-containing protein [Balneolia bacterium]|nr:cupin domain-containing protein [Balneolia bacterium]
MVTCAMCNRFAYVLILTASLLFSLGFVGLVQAQHGDMQERPGHFMLAPDELEWGPVASMGDGAEIAIIEGDLSAHEPFTFRLKLQPGYEILPHIHPEYERVTVLSGTLYFAHGYEFNREETRELPVGGIAIMPPGDPMFGYVEEETIIQLHGNGPWGIEYINPEDDPRRDTE